MYKLVMFTVCICSVIVARLNVPKDYCPVTTPHNHSIDVGITMHIHYADYVDNKLHAGLYLREMWTDPRLAGLTEDNRDKTGGARETRKLWQPDLFFPDATLVTHVQPDKTAFVRINPLGDVLLSRKYYVEIPGCRFNSTVNGFECKISVESYGYSAQEIRLRGYKGDNSVSINEQSMGVYRISSVSTTEKSQELATGTYTRVVAAIVLKNH